MNKGTNIADTKIMRRRFLIYGLIGWLVEITWTGLGSLLQRDPTLECRTSIWMFPIYGMVAFFEPLCDKIKDRHILIRGGVYTICIFLVEYATGMLLIKFTGMCPWDYSDSLYNINGIIRLDYAPAWFGAGLLFERIHELLPTIKVKDKNLL